jgi:hypothetical protein
MPCFILRPDAHKGAERTEGRSLENGRFARAAPSDRGDSVLFVINCVRNVGQVARCRVVALVVDAHRRFPCGLMLSPFGAELHEL